jgi:hypothetical protein
MATAVTNHHGSCAMSYFIKTPWYEYVSELCRPSDSRLSAKLVPTFADRGCHVVSMTDPHCRILGFVDRSRYIFFQVAPQLYSRGLVDPVPDPLLLRKSGSAGNRARTSGELFHIKQKNKHRGLSPRANYTDRAAASFRRTWCQLLLIEGSKWSA